MAVKKGDTVQYIGPLAQGVVRPEPGVVVRFIRNRTAVTVQFENGYFADWPVSQIEHVV